MTHTGKMFVRSWIPESTACLVEEYEVNVTFARSVDGEPDVVLLSGAPARVTEKLYDEKRRLNGFRVEFAPGWPIEPNRFGFCLEEVIPEQKVAERAAVVVSSGMLCFGVIGPKR